MSRFNLILVGIFVFSVTGPSAFAQTHFKGVSNTGNNATMAVPASANPNIMGTPLETGDEIGVFTPDGLCVGATTWEVNKNTVIAVWGDNEQTTEIDGIRGGEQMHFCVWRKSTNTGYGEVNTTYSLGDGRYSANGIYILSSLTANAVTAPLAPKLASPADKTTGISDIPKLSWYTSCSARTYAIQIAVNPAFSSLVVDHSGIDSSSYIFNTAASNTTYYWRVRAHNHLAMSGWSNEWSFTTGIISGVENTFPEIPQEYLLQQNYPNPVLIGATFSARGNTLTSIGFHLPARSFVTLKVYDLLGSEVATLAQGEKPPGTYQVHFDASGLPGGIYFYRLESRDPASSSGRLFVATKKLILLR